MKKYSKILVLVFAVILDILLLKSLYSKGKEKFTSVDKLPLHVVEIVDTMDKSNKWSAFCDAGSKITLSSVKGKIGNAVEMDYSFPKGTWAAINRAKRFDFAGKKGIRFFIRGEGNANNLEVKLEDSSGVTYGCVAVFKTNAGYWIPVEIDFESFEYWWGKEKELKWHKIKNIGFAVAIKNDGEGGSGKLFIDQIELIEN